MARSLRRVFAALAALLLGAWVLTGWVPGGPTTAAGAASASRPAMQVSVGASHACAVLVTGGILCWGDGSEGKLGDGVVRPTPFHRSTPVAVVGISTAVSVAAGGSASCAALADGTVRCWGRNAEGELGDGSTADRAVPGPVPGITTAVAVTAGFFHSCALLASGQIVCWGYGEYGQLGNGALSNSRVPVPVIGISTVTDVSAGTYHTCARLADSTVACWGLNTDGQIGNGKASLGQVLAAPQPVIGISGARSVSAGHRQTCAVVAGGSVWCWGWNAAGQLGDGTMVSRSTPVRMGALTGVTHVAAGTFQTCAVLADGTARCTGLEGMLGDGLYARSTKPFPVVYVSTANTISSGGDHSCIVTFSGYVRCWGIGVHGENDAGTALFYWLTPVTVRNMGP